MKIANILSAAGLCLSLLISCNRVEPEVAADIKLSRTEIELAGKSASAQAYLGISSNHAWTAAASADWISLSATGGDADKEYKILVKGTDNTGTQVRECTIKVTSGISTRTVKVIQERGALTLTPEQIPNYDRIYNAKGEDHLSLSSDGKWFYGRSAQSEHFIVFWEAGYGEFGDVSPSNCTNSRYRVDIDDLLDWAEKCYATNVGVLKFAEQGRTQLDNYKFEIFLHYSTTWAAYGSGLDNTVGCLWLNPDAANSHATIAHEIGHSFQFQTSCDLIYNKEARDINTVAFRYDRGDMGTGFWEQTAQWQAAVMCPEEAFGSWYFTGTGGTSFCENAHKHFLHEDMRYGSYFLHYYWVDKRGIDFISKIWKAARAPQDALQSYMSVAGITLEEFNAELYDYASRVATWDFNDLRADGVKHLNKIPWNSTKDEEGWYKVGKSVCPEATGMNIIRLQNYVKGQEISIEFEGLPNDPDYNKSGDASVSGWTLGFVALSADEKVRYYSEPVMATAATDNKVQASWTVPSDTKRLWAVVAVTPTKYMTHLWDENNDNDRLWPYRFKVEGAVPVTQR